MEALWNKNIGEKVSIPTGFQFPVKFEEYTVIAKKVTTENKNKFVYTISCGNSIKTVITF